MTITDMVLNRSYSQGGIVHLVGESSVQWSVLKSTCDTGDSGNLFIGLK